MAHKSRMHARKKTTGTKPKHREQADEHAANELVMYIENTADLSPDGPSGQGRSVLLNALRKWRKGTYDPALAVRLFEYLVESGAKRYAVEFGSSPGEWGTMFNPATRYEAAKQLEESFRSSAKNGEYDHVDTRIGTREWARDSSGGSRNARETATTSEPALVSFSSWPDVLAYARTGGDLYYQAPLNYRPVRLRPGKNQTLTYEVRARSIRIWPPGSIGRGRSRTADPFTADAGHLDRFSRPSDGDRSMGAAREAPRRQEDRPISMTYGVLPPFEEFERDIRRNDPNTGEPYLAPGDSFKMELVDNHEIELAESFGLEEFEAERQRTGRNTSVRGFKDNERAMYEFIEFLADRWNNGDEAAGELASTIMYTLGYEWI